MNTTEIISRLRQLADEIEGSPIITPILSPVIPPIIPPVVPPVMSPVTVFVPDKSKIYYISIFGDDAWYPNNKVGYGSPEKFAAAIMQNWNLWKMGTPEAIKEAAAFYADWPQYFPDKPVVTPPIVMGYNSGDISPHTFPDASEWLIADLHGAPYLLGKMWWLLEEMAKAADKKITVLQGCPLDTVYEGSPAHRPCNELGGGMTVDCKYPSVDGKLDVAKMKAMVDKFLAICCALIPGQEWRDIANESEVRIGGDVASLIKYFGNRHIQVDDGFHHRYDDTLYPHFHIKWHIPDR